MKKEFIAPSLRVKKFERVLASELNASVTNVEVVTEALEGAGVDVTVNQVATIVL